MALPDIKTIPKPASAEDVRKIVSAIKYINDLLVAKGYTVETLENPLIGVFPYVNVAAKYQAIENDLAKISNNELESAYFVKKVIRGYYEPNRAEWQRWIDILVDMNNMLNGQVAKWQYIKCSDGYPTVNGQKILLRGVKING